MIHIKIDALLKLSPSTESLQTIESFIQSTTLPIKKYQSLFIHLLYIKYELGFFKDVFEQGKKYFEESITNELDASLDRLYEVLFMAALQLNQMDDAQTFYQLRSNVLPVKERYKAELNLIELKKRAHEPYHMILEQLIGDVIPDEIKLQLAQELIIYYMENYEENKALVIIEAVKKIDSKQTFIPLYLKVLYQLGHFEQAKNIANQYKNHPHHEMAAFLTLLKIYLQESDYHRATILDADFNEKIETQDLGFQIETYTLLKTLYEKLNNKYSFDLYDKKLKNLMKKEKKIKLDDKTNDEKHVSQEKLETPIDKAYINTLKLTHQLLDLIAYSHQIAETNSFREFLRTFFMRVSDEVSVKNFIVFTKKDEMLYHYIKERLYDKPLIVQTYQETLIGEILSDGEEKFGTPHSFKYDKDILTSKVFDQKIHYVYGFPLFDLGVFLVYLDEPIVDPGEYYDFFKGLSIIIYTILEDEAKKLRLRNENELLNNIFDSKLFAVRMMSQYTVKYNILAQQTLNVDRYMPFESFLSNMPVTEVNRYEKAVKELLSRSGEMKVLNYRYHDKQITEKMMSLKHGNDIYIISSFHDITDIFEEKSKLMMEATIDFETSLENLNALNKKMPQYIQEKGSMILVNFNEGILPIYGYEDTLKFFKEFGQVTKKFFDEGDLYRFSNDQLFLYLPFNDIRAVTKRIKAYLRYIDKYESQAISYEKFLPKLAVIRYPVVTEEKNPAKLYRFLELSLDHLKRLDHHEDYILFEYKIYEDEVFEQQVINYLNQAIEEHQLSLTFHQLIDLERNLVWQYESELMLDNIDIDPKYLLAIAKKRHRLFDLEKYHLQMVCEFLKALKVETGKLVKITLPISKETILNPGFNPYLFGLFKSFQIPFEFIRFKIKADSMKSSQYLVNLNDIAEVGIGLDTTSLDVALSYPFHALHIDDKKNDQKWYDYLSMLKTLLEKHQMAIVIRNVKTKEERDLLKNLGIRYIEGPLYKKMPADQLLYRIMESQHDTH